MPSLPGGEVRGFRGPPGGVVDGYGSSGSAHGRGSAPPPYAAAHASAAGVAARAGAAEGSGEEPPRKSKDPKAYTYTNTSPGGLAAPHPSGAPGKYTVF